MAWHLAPALQTLLNQINAYAPTRDKRSDGTRASAGHHKQNPNSDHEPDGTRTVCALDVTHGPHWGSKQLDCHQIVDQLVASGDPRIQYVIFERRIWQGGHWSGYGGPSPHLEHFHISCRHGAQANDARAWNLPMFGGAPLPPAPPVAPPAVVARPPAPITNPIPPHPLEDHSMPADISFQQPPGQGVFMFRGGVRYGVKSPADLGNLISLAGLAGGDTTVHQCSWDEFMFLSRYVIDGDKLRPT